MSVIAELAMYAAVFGFVWLVGRWMGYEAGHAQGSLDARHAKELEEWEQ